VFTPLPLDTQSVSTTELGTSALPPQAAVGVISVKGLLVTQGGRSELSPQMKITSLFLALVATFWLISESIAQDQIWNAFGSVDLEVNAELGDWYESTYLPNLDSRKHHVRSRFALVDPIQLDSQFKKSLQDVDRFERDRHGRLVFPDELLLSESDILIEMFPGETYRISIIRHKIGRNSGMSMVRGWIMEDGFTGREQVYFEVKRDGAIIGSFIAKDKMYRVSATSKEGIVVISEFDHDGVMKSFRLH